MAPSGWECHCQSPCEGGRESTRSHPTSSCRVGTRGSSHSCGHPCTSQLAKLDVQLFVLEVNTL